jgi:hypothetical protein
LYRGDVERLFQLLCLEGILGERFERNTLGYTSAYITTGPRARQLLQGAHKVEMGVSKDGGKASASAAKTPRARGRKEVAAVAEDFGYDDIHDEDYQEEMEEDNDTIVIDDESQQEARPPKPAQQAPATNATYRGWAPPEKQPLAGNRGKQASNASTMKSAAASDEAYDKIFAQLSAIRAQVSGSVESVW